MNKNRGFTLIELMVVIAIITLLSSIVLVSVRKVSDRANETRIVQSIKNFKTALELYKNDYGTYPKTTLYIGKWNGTAIADFGSDFSTTTKKFDKYMKLTDAFSSNKFPNYVTVNYVPNIPDPFNGGPNMLLVCGSPVGSTISLYNTLSRQDTYTITIDYVNSIGIFSKIDATSAIYEGSEDFDTAGSPGGLGYFNNNTACFSNS